MEEIESRTRSEDRAVRKMETMQKQIKREQKQTTKPQFLPPERL
jgi:uncharacterized membrane protein (DUF106 family)